MWVALLFSESYESIDWLTATSSLCDLFQISFTHSLDGDILLPIPTSPLSPACSLVRK